MKKNTIKKLIVTEIAMLYAAITVACSYSTNENVETDSAKNASSILAISADTINEDSASAVSEKTVEEISKETAEEYLEESDETTEADSASSLSSEEGLLKSTEDINLTDVDGLEKNYEFIYDGETFSAIYTTDNWKIIDSYKITNITDIAIICQALIDVHPIHGSDMTSYRTAEDMAYEWLQHYVAYMLLSDDDPLKEHAKDVDLDPQDQNKSFQDLYKDRTGEELNLEDFTD